MPLILFFLQHPGMVSAYPRWNRVMTPVGSSKLFVEWEVWGQRIKMKAATATALSAQRLRAWKNKKGGAVNRKTKSGDKMVVLFKSRRGALGPVQDTSSVLQLPGASWETPRHTPNGSIHLLSFLLCFPPLYLQLTTFLLCQKQCFLIQTHY